VNLVSLMSNSDQRLDQNVLMNPHSRSKMMDCGIKKWNHTHLKNSLVLSIDVMIFF
jgi:hypothetical protein